MTISISKKKSTALDVVIDTDTGNETDDQFALVYALLAPEIFNIRAIMAAPFLHYRVNTPGEGMQLSMFEIKRILKFMNREDIPVWEGVRQFTTPFPQNASSGVKALIEMAETYTEDQPLTVFSIAALTNMAAVLRTCPDMKKRLRLVWLGSHSYRQAPNEFNLAQDYLAAVIVFNSGLRKVIFPCRGVAEKLYLDDAEVERRLIPCGALGQFLANRFRRMFGETPQPGNSLSIWDIAPFAWRIVPDAVIMEEEVSHGLCPHSIAWEPGNARKELVCRELDRDRIFADFFRRLERFHRAQRDLQPNDF